MSDIKEREEEKKCFFFFKKVSQLLIKYSRKDLTFEIKEKKGEKKKMKH